MGILGIEPKRRELKGRYTAIVLYTQNTREEGIEPSIFSFEDYRVAVTLPPHLRLLSELNQHARKGNGF